MNYTKIGAKIRNIRENELKKSRENFAEELGISLQTATRLENASSNVNNVEIYLKISELTGYTIEELLLDKEQSKEKEKIKRKIDYILNLLSEDELEYIYGYISQFVHFVHKDDIRSLKDIKKENRNTQK